MLTWGCADHRAGQPAPAAQTAQRRGVRWSRETTAVVERVDQTTREVELRAGDRRRAASGSMWPGPRVRNLLSGWLPATWMQA